MAMPPSNYPQLTFFEVAQIHTDGKTIVLRNNQGEHIFSISLLTCYDQQVKIYQHEPKISGAPSSGEASSEADDEIPF